MELTWRFRLSHYLAKNPTDFKWLKKTLRYTDNDELLSPDKRQEMKHLFLRCEKDGPYPESLIRRLCQYFTNDTALEIILKVFRSEKGEFLASHKDYNIKCPTYLITDQFDCFGNDMAIAKKTVLTLLEELTATELQRVKVFLADNVVEGVRHIPCGTMEMLDRYDLSNKIVNQLYEHYKCVMFAILTALDRNDLLHHLQIPCGTSMVA